MWQLRARLVFEDCTEAEGFSNQSPVHRSMAIQAALDVRLTAEDGSISFSIGSLPSEPRGSTCQRLIHAASRCFRSSIRVKSIVCAGFGWFGGMPRVRLCS